jgi:hypothetical protein
LSHVNHSKDLSLPANEAEIASNDFDFSLTPITSPTFNWYEGILPILRLP